jgi:hypothetical protein
MNNLKIATRLMVLIGVLSALLMAVGGLGLVGIGQSNAALRSVFEDRTVPAAQLGWINALVLRNRVAVNAVALRLVRTVAVFKLAQDGLEPPAVDNKPSARAIAVLTLRSSTDRRGPDAARAIARPAHGAARPAMAKAPATTRAGTDDWDSF